MTTEEIKISMGLDSSPMAEGSRKAQAAMDEFKDKVAHGFEHATASGRQFHKLLEQIKDVSPLLGTAVQAAFNPITAVVATVTLALQTYLKTAQEFKADYIAIASQSIRRWNDLRDAIREAKTEAASKGTLLSEQELANKTLPLRLKHAEEDLAKTQAKITEFQVDAVWLRQQIGSVGSVITGMQVPVSMSMERTMSHVPSRLKNKFKQQSEMVDKLKNERDTEKITDQQAEDYGKNITEGLKKEKADYDKLLDVQARNAHETLEAQRAEMTHAARIISLEHERLDLQKKQNNERKESVRYAELEGQIQGLNRAIGEQRKASLQASREAENKEQSAREDTARSALTARQEQANRIAPYQPSLPDLAKHGWGELGQMARREQWLEAGARAQLYAGNRAGAMETITGKGGIEDIRKQLENAGIIKPELTTKDMEDSLRHLVEQGQAARHVIVDNAA